MFLDVNGARLFVEVVGSDSKPALIALHGGPGFDHTTLRPFFDRFADLVRVVYLDQRGNGRSTGSPPESWTLAQWGDDVKVLCDRLAIERPIVMGQSFGGFVAQSYAIRHSGHPRALLLLSTAARMDLADRAQRIEQAGGPAARAAAERMWRDGTEESFADYARVVLPLYATMDPTTGPASKVIRRLDVAGHFYRAPAGEIRHFDFRAGLAALRCPALVLTGGAGDLITPPEAAREIADAMSPGLARYECLEHCRHGVFRDDPAVAEAIIRSFLADVLAREGC
jgi:proline iminopeptidase